MRWPWHPAKMKDSADTDDGIDKEIKRLRLELTGFYKTQNLTNALFDRIERQLERDNETFKSITDRIERIEASKTPNQSLIEAYEQIGKKLVSLDMEKTALAQQTRDCLNLLNKSPDWLIRAEQKEAERK